MRYIIIILLLALTIPFIIHRSLPTSIPSDRLKPISSNNDMAKELRFKIISYEGKDYNYDYFIVTPTTKFKIINNLIEKRASQDLIDQKSCSHLTNAGFYSKTSDNIGHLVIDGDSVSPNQSNQLFNGVVFASNSGQLIIAENMSDNSFLNGFQTGPLLIYAYEVIPLKLKNDSHERRMVAVSLSGGNTVFLTIIGSQGQFTGPLLVDLPNIITSISKRESFEIQSAINLDGGTASVFYNGVNYLKELQSVGTFLCFN